MTEPERFREVEPVTVDSEECANGESGVYLRVGGLLLDAAEARALRDWLNRALPEEPVSSVRKGPPVARPRIQAGCGHLPDGGYECDCGECGT